MRDDWKQEIRALEAEASRAFLAVDTAVLDRLWAENYAVNSPLLRVNDKRQVLALLQAGRIRHTSQEVEIEHMSRHGDVVLVMGRDAVTDPPDGAVTRRRFTNVWQLVDGEWRAIGRHAQIIAP
jgi:uncharacterized protein DUF4440